MSEFQTTPPVERVPIRIPVQVPQPVFNVNISPVHSVAGGIAAARGLSFQAPAGSGTHLGAFSELQQTVANAIRTTSDLHTMKQQTLQAFAGPSVFISDTQTVSRQFEAVMSSTSIPAAQEAVRNLLTTVKQQHNGIKQQRMADFVQAACNNLHFNAIEVVQTNAGVIKINASNLAGYAPEFVFAHEVRINHDGEVILTSETLCLEDSSCKAIMQAFNDEMDKLGVPLRNTRRTPRVPVKIRKTAEATPSQERKHSVKSKQNV